MGRTEQLVFLVNEQGQQARVAVLRVQCTREAALRLAEAHGFLNCNLVERADSEFGFSDSQYARIRNGVRT